MTEPLLRLKNISKRYHGKLILDSVSLDVHEGEVLCLIGPSGAGKTTLLKVINLIIQPDSGEIIFNGESVYRASSLDNTNKSMLKNTLRLLSGKNNNDQDYKLNVELNTYRCNFGMVFQEFNLWPNLTLFDNIAAPLKWSLHLKDDETNKRVKKYADLVQIKDILLKYPNETSGGQKQRAAIARALVVKPSILLLDEITSALDPELVSGVLHLIEELRSLGHAMIIVTHHMAFAKKVSDKIAFISKNTIWEYGINDLLETPQTNELKDFLSYFNEG